MSNSPVVITTIQDKNMNNWKLNKNNWKIK